jgi:type IV secretion system protein VirB9
MMRALVAAICLALPALAIAESHPSSSPLDSRIKAVPYNSADVVKVVGRYGYTTLIEFGANEVITDLALGDTLAWEVAPSSNRRLLFIKPREDNAATNLSVVTNLRTYQFMLQAAPHANSPSGFAAFAVRFTYPEEEAARRRAEEEARLSRLAFENVPKPVNWNYWACGAQQLRPSEVFDDGRFTYLRFPGAQEIPAVFIINADGTESLSNGQMRGDRFVVFATAPKLVLRKGNAVACVENRSFNYYGISNPQGTTSPFVTRHVLEAPAPIPTQTVPPAGAAAPATAPAAPALPAMPIPMPMPAMPAAPSPATPAPATDDASGDRG